MQKKKNNNEAFKVQSKNIHTSFINIHSSFIIKYTDPVAFELSEDVSR